MVKVELCTSVLDRAPTEIPPQLCLGHFATLGEVVLSLLDFTTFSFVTDDVMSWSL
jgi:hypothetical protein